LFVISLVIFNLFYKLYKIQLIFSSQFNGILVEMTSTSKLILLKKLRQRLFS